jgi:hypothetical protein
VSSRPGAAACRACLPAKAEKGGSRPVSFNEVRDELGYRDLKFSETSEPRLVQALTNSLPSRAAEYARRWSVCGPPLVDYFETLRTYIEPKARAALMADFRDEASHLPDCAVDW